MMSEYYDFYKESIDRIKPYGVGVNRAPSGNTLRFCLTDNSLSLKPITGDFTSFHCEISPSGTMTAALFSRRSDGTPIHPDFRAGQFLRVAILYFDPDCFLADWLVNQPKGMATYGEEYMKLRRRGYYPLEAALETACGKILSEVNYIPRFVDESGNNIVRAYFMKPEY